MYSKTVLGLVMTVAAYYWLMTGRFTALEVIGVYVTGPSCAVRDHAKFSPCPQQPCALSRNARP